MIEPRDTGTVFSELMKDAAEKVRWNRKQAEKMMQKADEIEEWAAITAEKYRELAASLVLEASSHADNVSDLLMAEYPMTGGDVEDE